MKALINPQWAEALGLTLFDSLWQGALVLIASFVVLLFMKKASPAKRYAVVLVAILILPLLSITTFLGHLDNGVTTSTFNSPLDFENTSVFSLEFNEASSPVKQVATSPTLMAKWKAWTSQNANLALVVWLMGAFLFTVRMLGGFYFLNRLKSRANLITDSVWLEKMSELCNSLKIKGKVLLKQSERVSSPLVMGVIKPVIIFPMGLIQALPTDEIEAILVHELAHIKRKDFLINIVINLLQVVYFFHPAFWWLKIQLDAEREFHCDDIALNQLGKKLTLIKALTNASEFQGHKFQPALAFAGKKNQLLSRVKRIVDHKPQMNWLSGFMSLGILVLSFVLMSQNASQADQPTMADLEEDNIESLMQNPVFQDTTKVNKAILELLNPNSKVTVKTDAFGAVTMIMNDKTEITGEEFEAYKTAYNQIHRFSEEHQSAKKEFSQELIDKVNAENRRIDEALKARHIANANKAREYNQQIDAELEKREQQYSEEMAKAEAQNEVNMARIRSELRKVEREIPQTQMELKELEKQLKATGKTDTALLNQYKKRIEKLNTHWRTLNSYSGDLKKYEREVNQYLEKMNTSIDFSAPKIRYEYMGKIIGEEEMSQYKLVGLRVSEIIEDYPVYDEKERKEIKVKLVKLVKDTVKGSPETSAVRYMVDGKLRDSGIMNTLDPNQIENISVIKGEAAVLKRYPDIPTPVSGLIIITTKRSLLQFTAPDSQDSDSVYYAFNGNLIDRSEASKLLDANQALSITVMKSKSEILVMFPEVQSSNPKLIILDSTKDYEKSSREYLKRFPYYTSYQDLGIVSFDQSFNNSIRTSFTIAAIKEDNAILEIDGELKPDMTDDQIKALDLMKVQSIQIIKNDKMYDYHKKRKLKGYDALIRIVTK
ncbi:beta-lactamase regulating signal transducer with metallopeptidase domain [Roseivirga ehrenbergii]|uniref:Peptidase M56 domain-containing protein n=1 Tax=Roseivirga ehrenbergii (strain DSM 102268 / JCM 13514 / KCTC 12282 / NCIMB 14502 / KMM 6017) TaxID=279360 RepID=A0A150XCI0_ROSEK|nr:M56 family metallopeptidase [Roseivirga ehrenbergii]KYG76374.1 hypothetical protein MB14_03765 [Roseivirga ehrenbergii]TCL00087.1 beta-lactamase regulating signal transducer with metallopeptidase domain [Roseivirga ehrenbergii]